MQHRSSTAACSCSSQQGLAVWQLAKPTAACISTAPAGGLLTPAPTPRPTARDAASLGTSPSAQLGNATRNLTTVVTLYERQINSAPTCISNSTWLKTLNSSINGILRSPDGEQRGGLPACLLKQQVACLLVAVAVPACLLQPTELLCSAIWLLGGSDSARSHASHPPLPPSDETLQSTVLCPYTCLNLGSFATLFKLPYNCICDQDTLQTMERTSAIISTVRGPAQLAAARLRACTRAAAAHVMQLGQELPVASCAAQVRS